MKTQKDKRSKRYDFRAVEKKWRPYWQEIGLYRTDEQPGQPDIYILDYFPYPSGAGLSVGHCRNYIPSCVSSRFHRMRGYNVLHPMGWDAFGLPAENYAITHGIHPRESSAQFSATYKRQMKLIECAFDWSREFSSTEPNYYQWTQWFFLLLHRRGLAYQAWGEQWWCPNCQTILANEQVVQGQCWRCGTEVTKKEFKQWYFRITAYADRLLEDLDSIDWPESIKAMQRNWVGRSEGAEVVFQMEAALGADAAEITVFTTRPDTLYGVTFLALAPEHEHIMAWTEPAQRQAVADHVAQAKQASEKERTGAVGAPSGVFTGSYAKHPLTGEPIPVWVADYVLSGYGTGAIMGVPAHDERDYAFATHYCLPVKIVVNAADEGRVEDARFTGEGTVVNSGPFEGLPSTVAGQQIVEALQAAGLGKPAIRYKMRDWLISRQRYWGAPIPIIHCPTCGAVPVPEEALPVTLPAMEDFSPAGDGRSPLARATEWLHTPCPQCGGPAERETDTMDGFACSSWYFLRFASPHYDKGPFEPEAVARWLPVDVYVGGAEHAVMHLLYARFWTKVMADAGLISFVEPFTKLRNQGMMLSAVDGQKMSKSKGNVVTPDEVVAQYGTDVLRAYILFLGPFDAEVMWDERGIVGMRRFVERFWRVVTKPPASPTSAPAAQEAFERQRQQIIQRVTKDFEQFRFNTAVAALMAYLNDLQEAHRQSMDIERWRSAVETMTILLAPIMPFVTEEVWQSVLGHMESVHRQPWPAYDPKVAAEPRVTIVIQVNGRVRDRVQVAADATDEALRETALRSADVQQHLQGHLPRKVIVVPGQLVNVVV